MTSKSAPPLPPFGHAVAGAAGAMFALAVVYPLDIIKTRLQVQSKSESKGESKETHYKSTSDAFVQILRQEGITGLYAGLPSALVGVASTNFTYFYFYSSLRKRSNPSGKTLSTAGELALGAAAGALATIFTIPVSVITTLQQTLPPTERQSLWGTGCSIVKEDGPQGLWRGLQPSLVLCVNPAITYGSFEKIKELTLKTLKRTTLTPLLAFYVGAFAKTLATIVTYPYIMAKVRMQYKPPKELRERTPEYKGALDVLARTLKNDGILGWYKGMSAQITKAVLSQALLFMMKDIFTNYTVLAYAIARRMTAKA